MTDKVQDLAKLSPEKLLEHYGSIPGSNYQTYQMLQEEVDRKRNSSGPEWDQYEFVMNCRSYQEKYGK